MERDDDIIYFNPHDKSRYEKLDGWIPIEAAPALHESMCERERELQVELGEAQSLDVMDTSEHLRQHKIGEAQRRLVDLRICKAGLGKLAQDEIVATLPVDESLGDIPGLDLTQLYQK